MSECCHPEWRFQVITAVNNEWGGNSANLIEVWRETGETHPDYEWSHRQEEIPVGELVESGLLDLYTPVFHVGEIIIVNDYGREIGWPGRKADKWDVTYESFDCLADARDRAEQAITEWGEETYGK